MRVVPYEGEKVPVAGRPQADGVGRFVDRANYGLPLDRDVPSRAATEIRERALYGPSHGGHAVQAGRPVRVIDDDISDAQVVSRVARQRSALQVVKVAVVHTLRGQVTGVAMDAKPILRRGSGGRTFDLRLFAGPDRLSRARREVGGDNVALTLRD